MEASHAIPQTIPAYCPIWQRIPSGGVGQNRH